MRSPRVMALGQTLVLVVLLVSSVVDGSHPVTRKTSAAGAVASNADGYVNGPSAYNVVGTEVRSENHLSIALKRTADQEKTNDNKYGNAITELMVDVWQTHQHWVRVKISDKNTRRWEVPTSLFVRGTLGNSNHNGDGVGDGVGSQHPGDRLYEFDYQLSPFSFRVVRKADNFVLFDSCCNLPLVFKDQYLQIATSVPDDLGIYGLGESTRNSSRIAPGEKRTLWARDQFAAVPDVNLYSSHPFYLALNRRGNAHGVLLLNSNGMDVTLEEEVLVYQTLGGVLDFFVFVGGSPADVVAQYTTLIGKPAMMPFWSFGFHQSRWGYTSVDQLQAVVANYTSNGIPLDAIWSDIDHMNHFNDFTLDGERFAPSKLKSLVKWLHRSNRRIIAVADPGLQDNETDEIFVAGRQMNAFIKNRHGKPVLGQVWPGPTVFPDFFNPNTTHFWVNQFQRFHDRLFAFDGIWIDMNELANFCPGLDCARDPARECPFKRKDQVSTCCLTCVDKLNSKYNHPPFAINNFNRRTPIFNKTIAADALHYGGVLEYDAHNLYGFMQSIATELAAKKAVNKRPFVLSRSTFPGSGAYVAHWTGDTVSSWKDLRWSIPTILNFGLFGIPMVGADICGFWGKTNEQLCARWTELGAFYPFARNHNDRYAPPQETYMWNSVAAIGRKFIGMRYQLLPYLYTTNYEAHITGAPMARALFYEFPRDFNCHVAPAVDRQYLLGSALLVSPVLEENSTSVDAYLPKGVWYGLFDHTRVESEGQVVHFRAELDEMPVHLRGGSILPMQEFAVTSDQVAVTPFTLVVALDTKGTAVGSLYLDDGEEMDAGQHATQLRFVAKAEYLSGGFIQSQIVRDQWQEQAKAKKTLAKVVILGVQGQPSAVYLNPSERTAACSTEEEHSLPITFNSMLQRLEIHLTSAPPRIASNFSITWQ